MGNVQTLINGFKDLQRNRKPHSKPTIITAPEKSHHTKLPKRKCLTVQPDILEGEDDVSFERHNRVLQAEWKKSSSPTKKDHH